MYFKITNINNIVDFLESKAIYPISVINCLHKGLLFLFLIHLIIQEKQKVWLQFFEYVGIKISETHIDIFPFGMKIKQK